jgi:hypothetical protein
MNKNQFNRGFLKTAVVLGLALSATLPGRTHAESAAPSTQPSVAAAAKSQPPASLQPVVTKFKTLFDNGVAGDWDAAAKTLAELKSAAGTLKHDVAQPSKEQKNRLSEIAKHLGELKKAIDKKNTQALLDSSNRGLRVTQVLASTYASQVPQSLWQMQYLARDLKVWSTDPADLTKLKALPARLDTAWAKIDADLQARDARGIASEYSAAMASLKASATAEEFQKQWKSLADVLNRAEAVYLK